MNSLRTLLLAVTIMFTSIFGAGCEDEDPKREDDPAPAAGPCSAAGEVVAGEVVAGEEQEAGEVQSGTESLAGEVEAGDEVLSGELAGESAGEQALPVEGGEDLPSESQEADMGVEEPDSESIPG